MRCLALAHALQETGGQVVFVMIAPPSTLVQRLINNQVEVIALPEHLSAGGSEDAERCAALAEQTGSLWVVLDGYQFDTKYQRRVKDAGLNLLFVDDYGHAEHYYADLLLNQNIDTLDTFNVKREPYTRMLLGTHYAMLRREFRSGTQPRRVISPHARKLLVTLGGSDPDNATLKVIQALQHLHTTDLEVMVVVGTSNVHYETLVAAARHAPIKVHLQRNVTDMPGLMAWADLAISGGGSTCWEMAYMGLPNMIVLLAENQRGIAEGLEASGASVNMGWQDQLTPKQIGAQIERLLDARDIRAEMSEAGRGLVDGSGALRVVKEMQNTTLILRLANANDCHFIWEWANAPDVRAVSFNSAPIPYETHLAWFNARLADPDCVFFVATDIHGAPIGQARFQVNGDEAVVSVVIAPQFRGKGQGSKLIWMASRRLFQLKPVSVIHAFVKLENESSHRAFTKAGYREQGAVTVENQRALRYVLTKDA